MPQEIIQINVSRPPREEKRFHWNKLSHVICTWCVFTLSFTRRFLVIYIVDYVGTGCGAFTDFPA